MASIHKTKAGYAVQWRYAEEQFQQNASDISLSQAEVVAKRVEEAIQALKQGWLELPEGADYAAVKRFIFTRGEATGPDTIEAPRTVLTLGGLFALYRESLPSNEASTLYTE